MNALKLTLYEHFQNAVERKAEKSEVGEGEGGGGREWEEGRVWEG